MKDNILVQWKAVVLLLLTELAMAFSIYIYAMDIFKFDMPDKGLYDAVVLIFIILIIAIKLIVFEYKERWQDYLAYFGEWPEAKRKRWNLMCRFVVGFIFANLALALYFMSQIDWKNIP